MGLSTEWAVGWTNLGLWMVLSTDLAFWWMAKMKKEMTALTTVNSSELSVLHRHYNPYGWVDLRAIRQFW